MSEMRVMACPECATDNPPMAVVNQTEQYRCRKCGMIYYSPAGCDAGDGAAPAGKADPEAQLGGNWAASSPKGQ